ncbi:MAG: AAA family ATPase, partial [Acetobacteraceae bacterium]
GWAAGGTMPALEMEAWTEWRLRLQRANAELTAEMAAAEEASRSRIASVRTRLGAATEGPLAEGITAFKSLFGPIEEDLFAEPTRALETSRALENALATLERHRRDVSDLVRCVPETIVASGAELAASVAADVPGGWRRAMLQRRKSEHEFALRRIIAASLERQLGQRAKLDAALQLALAQAALAQLSAWQILCRHRLAMLAIGGGTRGLTEDCRQWSRVTAGWSRQAQSLIRAYQRWTDASPARVARALLRSTPEISTGRQRQIGRQWEARLGGCRRLQRAVRTANALEQQHSAVAREAIHVTEQALESLSDEYNGLTAELDAAIGWLEGRPVTGSAQALPAGNTMLLTADQRARQWTDRLASCAQLHAPASLEIARRFRFPRAGGKPWRTVRPRDVLLQAIRRTGLDAARAGFQEAEIEHAAGIRDIEQAREALAFAFQAKPQFGEVAAELLKEAVANTLALLRRRREMLRDPRAAAEVALCQAQAWILLEARTALDAGRPELLALLARRGAPHTTHVTAVIALGLVRAAARAARQSAQTLRQQASWRLGWESPAAARTPALVARARLSEALAVELRPPELPALYRRLFSVAPVEDQRFLVGREMEMQGLADAFARWQAGGSTSVLLVGARGSGKTSLLNCAVGSIFQEVPVVRGEFCERIRRPEQITAFLRELLQPPPGADLAAALAGARRVAVIEELERSFLRTMGGLDALRALLRLVAVTASSTFWVLGINQASFQYLDAILGLGRSFSHRVNAMAVSPLSLAGAILQRHRLSGLQLQFAPLPPGDPRLHRARRFLGLEPNPRQMLFDALYRQSEALFRSAFELWLASIERIEGALVRMRQPLDPAFQSLEAELERDDLFALQAILQHASLTGEELAEVFAVDVGEARSRLERLQALEILEPEPAFPGIRVRPAAGRFVRGVLARQNLV